MDTMEQVKEEHETVKRALNGHTTHLQDLIFHIDELMKNYSQLLKQWRQPTLLQQF